MNRRPGDSITGVLPQHGENDLADEVRDKIGAAPDEEVSFTTPQFVRPSDDPVPAMPVRDRAWWEELRALDLLALKELGLRAWNSLEDPDDDDEENFGRENVLMMFPGEWYAQIPAGYSIVDIFGQRESFVPGQTDDDIRFGCLPYGLIVKGSPAPRQNS